MPVKHRLPEVLQAKCRHIFEERWSDEQPLEINPYKLKVLTGVGQGTSLKLFNDPYYIPDAQVMDAVCETFDLQPGDFLYYERSSNAQSETPPKAPPLLLNQLKDVVGDKHRIKNANQLKAAIKAATGEELGQGTILSAWKDPRWYPDKKSAELLCRTFQLQISDFIVCQ